MNEFEKNNFANFEASKAMKEAGFDGEVLAYYYLPRKGFMAFDQGPQPSTFSVFNSNKSSSYASAPTFLDSVKWFREKHNLGVETEYNAWHENGKFTWGIIDYNRFPQVPIAHGHSFETEPEAYNVAIIKACQIVKERKQ